MVQMLQHDVTILLVGWSLAGHTSVIVTDGCVDHEGRPPRQSRFVLDRSETPTNSEMLGTNSL